MAEHKKELVTLARFIELLNDALRHHASFQTGMEFVNVGTGYDFLAPGLSVQANRAMGKVIFDQISSDYTVSV